MKEGKHIYIIAEAGVNHNGSRKLAFQLVDAAVEAGADAVKFQTFKAEKLVTISAPKAHYQKSSTGDAGSQLSMLKKLELSHELHFELFSYCKKKKIDFLSTAFDCESLKFLVEKIGVRFLKIPSGEITNGPLLLAHAHSGKKLILSTGMSTFEEIEEALGVLAYGFTDGTEPSRKTFRKAYLSATGREMLKKRVTLLHCTSSYPTQLNDVHLRALMSLKETFELEVGYSDHSEGVLVPVMAATLGAPVIEKHFTIDRQLPGPDHKASLEPTELLEMVQLIRDVERVLGSSEKRVVNSEKTNKDVARKSLVAISPIKKGEPFSRENLTIKRPGTGRSPMDFWDLLGTISRRSYDVDEVISR